MTREPLSVQLRRELARERDPGRRRILRVLLEQAEELDAARREADTLGRPVWPRLDEVLEAWEREGKG